MGNCPACLSGVVVHHSNAADVDEREETVRVLRTTDNELFEFPGPVSVKDLLFGFHGFAVFHSQAPASKLPLHPDTQLNFSHMYYLKPWVKPASPLLTLDFKQNSIAPLVKPPLLSPLDPARHSSRSQKDDDDVSLLHAQRLQSHDTSMTRVSDIHKPLSDLPLLSPLGDEYHGSTLRRDGNHASSPHAERRPSKRTSVEVDAQNRAGDANTVPREPPSTQVRVLSPTKTKAVKKVRFAKELIFIEPAAVSTCLPSDNDEQFHCSSPSEVKGQMEGDLGLGRCETIRFDSAPPKLGVLPDTVKKEVNGVVRLRVVISKKQLTELMSPKSAASMEKMLAPLLSPAAPHHQHSLPWRPSLDHIPEAHSSQELLMV